METETNETNEINDITPEIAREMTQEATNWDDIIQRVINECVPYKAKEGKRECRIVIGLPLGMKIFTKTSQEIIRGVFVRKGWKIQNFDVDTRIGAALVDIEW